MNEPGDAAALAEQNIGVGTSKNVAYIEFLGQKIIFPMSPWAAVIAVALGATIVSLTLIFAGFFERNPGTLDKTLGLFATVGKSEIVDNAVGQRLLRFWTPSEKTKRSIDFKKYENLGDKKLKDKVPPYYYVSDDGLELDQFAEKLNAMNPQGWRFYEVMGRGTTSTKPGYFWELTADMDNALFKRDAFIEFYHLAWKRPKEEIYLEVFPISNTYQE